MARKQNKALSPCWWLLSYRGTNCTGSTAIAVAETQMIQIVVALRVPSDTHPPLSPASLPQPIHPAPRVRASLQTKLPFLPVFPLIFSYPMTYCKTQINQMFVKTTKDVLFPHFPFFTVHSFQISHNKLTLCLRICVWSLHSESLVFCKGFISESTMSKLFSHSYPWRFLMLTVHCFVRTTLLSRVYVIVCSNVSIWSKEEPVMIRVCVSTRSPPHLVTCLCCERHAGTQTAHARPPLSLLFWLLCSLLSAFGQT